MNYQLSTEEIEKLFVFVESKNVQWKDVQYEIVDHLASAIEQNMANDSNSSFKLALEKIYSKFPITGFAQIVQEKEAALHKYWSKRYFSYLLQYFKLPKVVILLSLIYSFYYVLSLTGQQGVYILYACLLVVTFISYIFRRKHRYLISDTKDKHLVSNTFMCMSRTTSCLAVVWPGFITSAFIPFQEFGSYQMIIVACLTSIIILLTHADLFVYPDILKEEYSRKYGHLNIKLA